MKSSFTIQKTGKDNSSRAGSLSLPLGIVHTPVFMPVGTQATVKSTLTRDLHQIVKCPIILGNTYHLNLRPGVKIIRDAGGLSKFMNWNGPVLTDSGGFQVFSLAKLRKIADQGVLFRSHIDGSQMFLGPREAIDIQDGLHSDIAMCLDECPPAEANHEGVQSATERTTLWAKECLFHWKEKNCDQDGRLLFGIVQGGRFKSLRIKSAEELMTIDFPGYAIGGVSVGETEEEMLEQINWVSSLLPIEKPRYVMGVGTPPQLLQMIGMGADMFDCVMPSRAARHGMAFTKNGTINLRNEKFKEDNSPLDETLECCYISQEFTKAYIRHLIMAKESLAGVLLTLHNLRFFVKLMEEAREHILNDTFSSWSDGWIADYLYGIRKIR